MLSHSPTGKKSAILYLLAGMWIILRTILDQSQYSGWWTRQRIMSYISILLSKMGRGSPKHCWGGPVLGASRGVSGSTWGSLDCTYSNIPGLFVELTMEPKLAACMALLYSYVISWFCINIFLCSEFENRNSSILFKLFLIFFLIFTDVTSSFHLYMVPC